MNHLCFILLLLSASACMLSASPLRKKAQPLPLDSCDIVCKYDDCDSCAEAGCGWCTETQSCHPITSSVEWCSSNICAGGCMHHGEDNYCPPPNSTCSQFSDCFSCTSASAHGNDACAWCPATSRCLDYCVESAACDSSNNQYLCNSKDSCAWCLHYGVDTAHCPSPGKNCSDYHDCASCTNSASSGSVSCGWCTETQTCTDATSSQSPCDPTTPCDGGCYHTGTENEAHCPAAGKNCSDYTDCSSCTNSALSDNVACGWCTATNKCTDASGTGTTCNPPDTCSDGCYHTGIDNEAHCPAAGTSCSDYTDCASCTNSALSGNVACGWCTATNKCTDASGTGTTCNPSDTCTDGCYHTGTDDEAHCPAAGKSCSDYTDCASCTNSALSGNIACGWCTATNKCTNAAGTGTTCDPNDTCSDGCYHTGTFDEAHCPPEGTSCSDFTSQGCEACTQASESGSIACGWCADDDQCLDAAGVGVVCNSDESCSVFHTGVGTAHC